MTKYQALKEHKEHQNALKPILKHLKKDEKKLEKEKMRHKLTKNEEHEGGLHSHAHHKKMHDHHMKEAKKHADHLHKMAKSHHVTAHDRAIDRKNVAKARAARSK